MKRIFVLFTASLLTVSVFAQIKKGNFIISGGTSLTVNFLNTSTNISNGNAGDATKWNSVSFMPSFGYFVVNNLSVGLSGEVFHIKYIDDNSISNNYSLVPAITYFWPIYPLNGKLRIYSRLGTGITSNLHKYTYFDVFAGNNVTVTTRSNGLRITSGSGFSYFLKENISLNLDGGLIFNYLKNKDDSKSRTEEKKFFYDMGISVFF